MNDIIVNIAVGLLVNISATIFFIEIDKRYKLTRGGSQRMLVIGIILVLIAITIFLLSDLFRQTTISFDTSNISLPFSEIEGEYLGVIFLCVYLFPFLIGVYVRLRFDWSEIWDYLFLFTGINYTLAIVIALNKYFFRPEFLLAYTIVFGSMQLATVLFWNRGKIIKLRGAKRQKTQSLRKLMIFSSFSWVIFSLVL